MTRDYFYRLHLHHRPVNDLSTAVKLTNRLEREFVCHKIKSPQSVFSRLVLTPNCNITSWFAIALSEIRTRRILREKEDCKQSRLNRGHLFCRLFLRLKVFRNIAFKYLRGSNVEYSVAAV